MPMRLERRRDIIGRIQTITHDYEQLKMLVSLARSELGWSEQDYQPERRSPERQTKVEATPAASAVAIEGS